MTNAEIEQETGRAVHEIEVPCDMCDSMGWSMYEDPCTKCSGDGRITIAAFIGCDHDVESDDCYDEGCIEFCEQMVDLGSHCKRPYAETVREPFTPTGFELRCCRQCADDFLSQGYLKARAA